MLKVGLLRSMSDSNCRESAHDNTDYPNRECTRHRAIRREPCRDITSRPATTATHFLRSSSSSPNERHQTVFHLVLILDIAGEVAHEHFFLTGDPEIEE
jgi:hypothetical protein